VARPLQEFLHVDLVVVERGQGLALRDRDRVEQRGFAVDHAHAAAAAAARRLDDHRIADVLGDAKILFRHVAERTAGARHAGHAGLFHHVDGGNLVAHHPDHVGARADEGEAALLDSFGEVRVLGQEAVTRVDADRVRDFRGADDRRHVEVALLRLRRADAHRFVGEKHVLEVVVGRGVHRDRLDSELAAGAQDSERDLASIGDDDLVEHVRSYSMTKRG
jgi:hypothetical protein